MREQEHDGTEPSCDVWLDYMVGDRTEKERAAFERHLSDCPVCREEWHELRSIWDELHGLAEETAVPSALKAQVMDSIFGVEDGQKAQEEKRPESGPPDHKRTVVHRQAADEADISPGRLPMMRRGQTADEGGTSPRRRMLTLARIGGIAAAVLLGILIGSVGSDWTSLPSRNPPQARLPAFGQPMEIVRSYELRAFDAAMPAAKGNVWVLRQGEASRIVVSLQGLATTLGDEAYQVWLIHDGKRYNCGTLHVDAQGNGVLAYEVSAKALAFDSVGVTLEPDPNGSQPRGKKVLGM